MQRSPFHLVKIKTIFVKTPLNTFFRQGSRTPPLPVVNVEAPFELGTCEQQPTLTLWGKGGIFWECSNLFDKDCVRNKIFKRGCLQKI